MKIFKSAKVQDLEAKVASLETENAQLKTDLEAANSKAAASGEAESKLAALKAENAELKEANAEIEGLNATLKDQETEIANLKEKATMTAKKVDEAAAVKLAAMGHGQTVDLTGGDPTKSTSKTKGLTAIAKVTAAIEEKMVKK